MVTPKRATYSWRVFNYKKYLSVLYVYLFLIPYNQDKCITIVIKLAMEFRYEHV